MKTGAERTKRGFIKWVILVAFLIAINFYELPYYFTIPGDALELTDVIDVEGGYGHDGAFMLTTVRMGKANVVNYLWARLSDQRELIPEEQVRPEGETDEEYQHRQMMLMDSSQDLAVVVAYNHAGKTAYFENYGVYVTALIPDMDAARKLTTGDLIIAVDGKEVLEAESLLDLLADYQIGDEVTLTVVEGEAQKEVAVEIMPFPEELDETGERGGLGISNPMTNRSLIKEPEIEIDTNKIGGPSAGLMFSLEIYNQLIEADITKGYNIAGTGSIDEEGQVGRIGGVKQKVIAADKAGADFFFAPNENGTETSNYVEAKEAAEKMGMNMEIVPVDSFADALAFLEQLPPN
ncbi:PDZ domain-containing protein [Evansella caseinilytica]|uniref:endopeptidase La n=1 Tax=Evansella caseinilytica TaxID=1503961 RepID=A0A1H3MJQ3_9BACI|nr:SepM family pheromone-processing serine protease [Evansella caseinilytica]SDY76648.1 PDZ domain-containing protein [Evansella caseinilytica]